MLQQALIKSEAVDLSTPGKLKKRRTVMPLPRTKSQVRSEATKSTAGSSRSSVRSSDNHTNEFTESHGG